MAGRASMNNNSLHAYVQQTAAMPLEIKSKDNKSVVAIAIVADKTRCGHCDMPVLDGQGFFALDDPYHCLVHEGCLQYFNYDGKPRKDGGDGRIERLKEINADEGTIGEYMQRQHFQTRVPPRVRGAWIRVFQVYLSMRSHYGCVVNKRAQTVKDDGTADLKLPGDYSLTELQK